MQHDTKIKVEKFIMCRFLLSGVSVTLLFVGCRCAYHPPSLPCVPYYSELTDNSEYAYFETGPSLPLVDGNYDGVVKRNTVSRLETSYSETIRANEIQRIQGINAGLLLAALEDALSSPTVNLPVDERFERVIKGDRIVLTTQERSIDGVGYYHRIFADIRSNSDSVRIEVQSAHRGADEPAPESIPRQVFLKLRQALTEELSNSGG